MAEQQKIVEEDIGVGGERFRRPIGLAIAHIPIDEAVLQTLQKQRLQLFRDRERRLLISTDRVCSSTPYSPGS